MQNQSFETINKPLSKQIDDQASIPEHVNPYGSLWTHVPDCKTDWIHKHKCLELGRCIKGSGIFHVDGKIIRIQAPCYSIIYEGIWHSGQSNPLDQCTWNFLYVDLDYFISRMDDAFTSTVKGLHWQNYDFPQILDQNSHPAIGLLIDMIFEETSQRRHGGMEKLTGLLMALLTEHSRLMTRSQRKIPDQDAMERISPALAYIDAHFNEDLRIETLAKLCYISPATLRRDFQSLFNLSPNAYLHKLRIKHAANMLSTSDKTVMAIAMDTGYPTLSSFNRQFNLYYHVSPREYRKKNRPE